MRKVAIEDLLRRDPITTDLAAVAELVREKVVLVTGAGGSIGSELCRQIAPLQPAKLLILDHRLSGLEEGIDVDITFSGIRPGEKLYEEVFFGHEEVTPTSHPKVLRSPAEHVDAAVADRIEMLIRSALNEPDNREALRAQLRALVPDFHVPPPPPSGEDTDTAPLSSSAERRLKLA